MNEITEHQVMAKNLKLGDNKLINEVLNYLSLLSLVNKDFYYAKWDWKPHCSTELTLERGDIVYVIEKTNEEWWKGRTVKDHREGYFPIIRMRPLIYTRRLSQVIEAISTDEFDAFVKERLRTTSDTSL